MKAISYLSLLALITVFAAYSFHTPQITPKTPDNITICLDSNCTLSTPVTCKLYDSNSTAIRQCQITSLSGRCCTVDSVPYPRT